MQISGPVATLDDSLERASLGSAAILVAQQTRVA